MVGMTSAPNIVSYEDKSRFEQAVIIYLCDRLDKATENNGKTTLFLSGGSTPGPMYKRMSRQKLKWSRIAIAQVDDRWVGLKDPGSNAALLHKTILRNKAQHAKFVRMKSRHHTALAGQDAVNALYSKLPMKNSLAVLGMGGDGHVCSWFPNAQGLAAAIDPANDNLVQAITAKRSKVTGPYLERMTLTLSALRQCGSLLLLITGAEKRKVLEHAIADPSSNLPVAHLMRSCKERLTVLTAET